MKLPTSKKIGLWELDVEERKNQKGQPYFCIRGKKHGDSSFHYFGSFSKRRIAQIKLQSFDPTKAQGSYRAEELSPRQEKNDHNYKKTQNKQ